MGYTTDFEGSLKLNRPATEQERNYINLISDTRRMKRNVDILFQIYKGKHGNPFAKNKEDIYGFEGEYFAMNDGDMGQNKDKSIIDYNTPPCQMSYYDSDFNKTWNENERRIENGLCQPGLWCHWIITEDCQYLEWDGGEKFYNYLEWLQYHINHFFDKWGIKLNGNISWQGEDDEDKGIIVVRNNKIKTVSSEKELLLYERKEKLEKLNGL
jgi:hypothetical protein